MTGAEQNLQLQANQILVDESRKKVFRLLWLDESAGEAFWIQVDGKSNIPSAVSVSSLLEKIHSRELSFGLDTWMPIVSEDSLTESAVRRRTEAWNHIRDIVCQEPQIYRRQQRGEILRQAEASTGVASSSLYVLLGKYWRRGKVPNALLPDYSNCGKHRDLYREGAVRVGLKKTEGAAGKTLNRTDLQNFSDAIQRYYLGPDKETLDKVYTHLLKDHYNYKDEDGKSIAPYPPDETPSLSQFLYWHNKNRNIFKEASGREGEKNYALRYRGGTGKTEDRIIGPGYLSQIDATIADINLVRQDDHSAIVGRPTLYFVKDAMSHIITGMHVSLDPPSWESATMALMNSSEDKVSYCRKFGITILEDEWPCHHIPTVLLADRGELESRTADLLVNQMGITLQNTPPYRGDLKGIIESHFHLVNADIRGLPGWLDKDFGERCTHDYRLDAILDIRQFTAIIIRCVLFYNNHHYLDSYVRTVEMRNLGVNPVPRDLWNYGIVHLSGGLRTLQKEYVQYSLLPKSEASITRQGILFNKMLYTCDLAEAEHWFDAARIQGRTQVSVSYDPRNAANIYLQLKPGNIVECHLVDHMGMLGDLQLAEIKHLQGFDLVEKNRYDPMERFQEGLLKQEIEAIVQQAKSQARKDDSGKSNAARIRDIAENLKKEKEAQRLENTKTELALSGRCVTTGPQNTGAGKPNASDASSENPPTPKTPAPQHPVDSILDALLDEALGQKGDPHDS